MTAGKTWLDTINLFSSNDYKNNDKIMNMYLKEKYGKKKKKNVSFDVDIRLKNRWNKKLSFRRNKTKWFNKWHKKVCRTLNCFEHFIFVSACRGCGVCQCQYLFLHSALVGVPTGITSSAVGLKIYVITAGIKNYFQ